MNQPQSMNHSTNDVLPTAFHVLSQRPEFPDSMRGCCARTGGVVSLAVLAHGSLIADPQQRTSAKGGAYVTAQLRVATDDGPILVSLIAFAADVVTALMALRKGDAASVSGMAKLTSWAGRDGETNHGLSVGVEGVLSAYAVGKRRRQTKQGSRAGADPTPS